MEKINKDKILVVGGYGNVGAIVSKILAVKYPDNIIVAGRNKEKAWQLIRLNRLQAVAKEIDLEKSQFPDIPFSEIHTAICCIEILNNNYFLEKCIKEQVNYTELATSAEAYDRLMAYKEKIIYAQIILVPGVGLVPGLSNVFAFHASGKLRKVNSVNSFLLLGLGELHGVDAIRWMLAYADRKFTIHLANGAKQVHTFSDPVSVRLLNEPKDRTFYRWDFADQHIIPRVINTNSAETRLAFDSRIITSFLAVLQKSGVLKMIKRVNPAVLRKLLSKVKIGTKQFTLQTQVEGAGNENTSKKIIYLASGTGEAFATGIIASYAIECIYKNDSHVGIKHLEEIISADHFFKFLEDNEIVIKTEVV